MACWKTPGLRGGAHRDYCAELRPGEERLRGVNDEGSDDVTIIFPGFPRVTTFFNFPRFPVSRENQTTG